MHDSELPMAEVIIMPKLGNTVEGVIILAWHVEIGDAISAGDVLCEVETDKATLEIESTAGGLLLARFYEEGDEAPVLSDIAVVGSEGESASEWVSRASIQDVSESGARADKPMPQPISEEVALGNEARFISPRARNLAQRKGIDYTNLPGSGPGGRIIERDIEAAIRERVIVTPVAQAMLDSGEYRLARERAEGRVGKEDLVPADGPDEIEQIPLRGLRKTIARRMLESSQTTAQLTLKASADARALGAFRKRLKESDEALGLRDVTINDLLLFAVARATPAFPDLNALFENETIYQHSAVQLGMAVDTERGLLVPVIRNAETLSLKQLSAEALRLAEACRRGKVLPDELTGGTFTVSNLGALGIESFTPLLNPPQVAILGVGSIKLQPVQVEEGVEFIPHIGLSLTINHQALDGAPAARFLAQLGRNLAQIDLLAAL
jgi:pyruvate dehydrogenase E2 component (dihydrolipoamide acetyltransferase)